jgi:DNA-binding transcriptional regulator YdaS (Cro superfamily)
MKTPKPKSRALARAIRQAGGAAALAQHIRKATGKSISTQAISQWRRCPAERVMQVVLAPGVVVQAHELRKDLYVTAVRLGRRYARGA